VDDILTYVGKLSITPRLAIFAGLAVVTHLVVISVRGVASHLLVSQPTRKFQKLKSIATLATSAIIFSLYFFAIGLILREFGVSLTAYLASASVIGLAIGFGSQGIVQDVVTGLTFIFSDLVDVGDLVEISGQSGMVKAITMRFVELENAMGAAVFIPNRTISNIINYPRGYVRCLVDITLRGDENSRKSIEGTAIRLMQSMYEQFPGILMTEPSSEGRIKFGSGKEILRIKFRIWPDRGQPIETTYCQELFAELKASNPAYEIWMISISYEVEKKVQQPEGGWSWRRRIPPPSFPTSRADT
jgi:moderate conductance mechanosensitive channel